jgi:hypothetical protein
LRVAGRVALDSSIDWVVIGEDRVGAAGAEWLTLVDRDGARDDPLTRRPIRRAVRCSAFAAAGKRGEADLGDLGVGDPAGALVVPDRLRKSGCRPRVLGIDGRSRIDRVNNPAGPYS